ncbi:MAG: C40 family peptidase [Flavobacteriales bacterium]|nr:C40 family peptidase [Flavobacteriia bacterium]NCP06683.1 C40 family peptidase [Flavobacteriales bacterium]PIV92907.1 MAG: NlpC/P60 family protein [Flavobacteriaceae bacterium CG17_big_fil_post_rev_8_21_14_2_50_33_15]PIY12091.1 MAG: NlpC/P60 family protein [Flavobacteriaceae bacterium CG_4_10_14_3_um_filter_33_47]PJB19256.1 MAG: NlpC/P60 family protein [Flavobacteriaceae bacterium CG_4_9_14_3_um_filter_33_16]
MGCKSSKTLIKDKPNSNISILKPKDSTNITKINSLTKEPINNDPSHSNTVKHLVDFAKQFEGVKYKFGGTTNKGMDCSGLVYETFKAFEIELPRISRHMATQGAKVSIDSVKTGDLLFFKTSNKLKTINHVGLVVTALPGNIEFIHSTTSLGVIISSLAERYWYYSFVEARRIL